MSSLAWIDFDEAERQRVQRIMEFFKDRDCRDELGLGAIRDSIADHLFPGTSTIQTRLRYMLFIPWLYRMLEGVNESEDRLRTRARDLEIRLIYSLMAGGERDGVIGREAGANLKRLPSWVYWAGLSTWGIRLFPGSTDSHLGALPGMRRPAVDLEEEKKSIQTVASLGISSVPRSGGQIPPLGGAQSPRFCMNDDARRRAAHASIFSLSRSTKRAAHGHVAKTLAESILPRSSKECIPFL